MLLIAGSSLLTVCSFSTKSTSPIIQSAEIDNSRNRVYWPTDDWRVSSPEENGMDSKKLELAKKRMREKFSDIKSLLIVRNGFLICEEDYNGYKKDDAQDIRSTTKSILSALVGIAIEKNYITGVNQRLEEIFSEYSQLKDNDSKREIKIELSKAIWEKDPNGLCIGGYGLQITPRDMAKIGFLYLNGGQWDGKQIIALNWIEESIKPRFNTQNRQVVTGSTEYGYLWWLKHIKGYALHF